ncbi:MAG: hypothetical protein ACOYOF_07995, partial [Verrucomicrobiaceae bacterium]
MTRLLHHSLVALALFALGCAQVLGLQRGFVCMCSGEAVETHLAHCDASEPCGHDEHEESEAGEHPCSHEHEHEPLTVEHEAPTQPAPSASPIPAFVAVWEYSHGWLLRDEVFATLCDAVAHPPPQAAGSRRRRGAAR